MSPRTTLIQLFRAGVSAVKGDRAVEAWLETSMLPRPTQIFAAGKAAVSMFEGLPQDWKNTVPTLLVTKTDHIGSTVLGGNVTAFEAGHPIPNARSLNAGLAAKDFVESCDPSSRLLCLISGGASSLVEHLKPEFGLDDLVALNKTALGDGADIAEINRRRKRISMVKDGNLLSGFKGQSVHSVAISDVYGDRIDVIGSGLGAAPLQPSFAYNAQIIASNQIARDAVIAEARNKGLITVLSTESMYADVTDVAKRIADQVNSGPHGVYVFGGEPTVVLPEKPGKGGRNQALALELARYFRNCEGVTGLVAGTDGSDGPTEAAGAYFDGSTFDKDSGAPQALIAADSASYLARSGDQLVTGPTGTNVMDLAIIIKHHVADA